ncbi:MAG: hypothetical protein AAFZ09_03730, partial [Pseudomonadota bacterium]
MTGTVPAMFLGYRSLQMRVATPFDTSLVRHWACALSALALLGLAGCQTTGAEDTVRICDSSGCFDAPRDYATFDPAANAPDDDPNGILGGLIIEAEADPAAAFDLGRRYLEGDGIRENPWEGIKWLRDAGQNNDGSGDNLYAASRIGIDPSNGEIKWHFQTTPREGWDFDGVNE